MVDMSHVVQRSRRPADSPNQAFSPGRPSMCVGRWTAHTCRNTQCNGRCSMHAARRHHGAHSHTRQAYHIDPDSSAALSYV
eukprot:scaffold15453_cov110-Isochrysis_galbana.AAC.5